MATKTTAAQKRFRRWVAENYPCRACQIEDDTRVLHHFTFLDAGMSQKEGDELGICMCYNCHVEKLHRHGEKSFWSDLNIDLDELVFEAKEIYRGYHANRN